ncbi:MAG: class I SAM-dependent methyltransferase [Bacteroidota bacterium]|nr:class I SAM-dependent methyltransferase [Bacteroidota bacterium]
MEEVQEKISHHNKSFWNELCGTNFAKELGITKIDAESLQQFDQAFFKLYPYLKPYLDSLDLESKKVVEIGLGFGTVAQYLVEKKAFYTGVDISPGPVEMANYRIHNTGLTHTSKAIVASALQLPFNTGTMDQIVSIGCLHHTGDLKLAIQECIRVLKPGGKLFIMIYNKYSLRSLMAPVYFGGARIITIFNRGLKVPSDYNGFVRWLRDHNTEGDAAPFTEFTALSDIPTLFEGAHINSQRLHNLGKFQIPFTKIKLRKYFLGWLDRLVGLDIYIIATKNTE